jgi:hypothetical protein
MMDAPVMHSVVQEGDQGLLVLAAAPPSPCKYISS